MRKMYQVVAKLDGHGVVITDITATSPKRAEHRTMLKLRAEGMVDFVHPEEVDYMFVATEVSDGST